MREILFRGKRTDNGEWETGSLVRVRFSCSDEEIYISDKMTSYHTPVDPATVGEYTGLRDANGKRIFEGDIISLNGGAYEVKFRDGSFYIAGTCYPGWCISKAEVIGNVHDNSELIGGGENG